jgi:hypothetical protein
MSDSLPDLVHVERSEAVAVEAEASRCSAGRYARPWSDRRCSRLVADC